MELNKEEKIVRKFAKWWSDNNGHLVRISERSIKQYLNERKKSSREIT